jgi:hypothetical protein
VTNKHELPANDDIGVRVAEEALVELADATPSPATATMWDANTRGVRDEEADLYHSGSDADAAFFSENNAREAVMWKGFLGDKRVLQRAGFGVWFVTAKGEFAGKHTQHIAVGKAVVTHAVFRAWADRTRRAARQQRDDA